MGDPSCGCLKLPTSDPPLCVGVFLRLLHGDGEADDGAGRQEVPAVLPRRHRPYTQGDGVLCRLLPLQSHLES